MKIFDEKKRVWFGEIKDFSDPQNKLRNTFGYKLSGGDWFWFNPFAYRWVKLGIPLTGALLFCGFGVLFFLLDHMISAAFMLLFCFICVWQFGKKWVLRKAWKKSKFNMYDEFLREYDE